MGAGCGGFLLGDVGWFRFQLTQGMAPEFMGWSGLVYTVEGAIGVAVGVPEGVTGVCGGALGLEWCPVRSGLGVGLGVGVDDASDC